MRHKVIQEAVQGEKNVGQRHLSLLREGGHPECLSYPEPTVPDRPEGLGLNGPRTASCL